MPQLNQVYKSLDNQMQYKVIDISGGEIVATTVLRDTPSACDSFSWLSDIPSFLKHFTPVKG